MLVGLGPIFEALGSAWAESAVLGYSRDLENEADSQGLEQLVKAGYDPAASLKVLEYLREEEELEGVSTRDRDSTHPGIQERIDHTRELLASRYNVIAQDSERRINRNEYLGHVRQVLLDNAVLDQDVGRLDFAQRAVDKYLAAWPDSAPGYFMRGEICRRRHTAGSQEQAEAAYRRATQLDPACTDPHRELGLLYRAESRWNEARDEFTVCITLSPQSTDVCIIQRYLAEAEAELSKTPGP